MYQCGVFEEFQYTTYSNYQPLVQYLYFLFILGFVIYTDEINLISFTSIKKILCMEYAGSYFIFVTSKIYFFGI